MKDLIGQAIWDYYHRNSPGNLQTETSISHLDDLPIPYLFREFYLMNPLEKKAMQLAKGRTLDVGAGAGPHSLYLQNIRGLDLTAIDISPKSIEICRERGIQKAVCSNLMDFSDEPFDTILLLMNGTGIFESLDKTDAYLQKLHALLTAGGQILIDGTDIRYMYEQTGGSVELPEFEYYGEVDFTIHYKGKKDDSVKWLYLDFETLKESAEANGFLVEMVEEDRDSYLAKLSHSS
ncbi:MAG: class I SAM-dependent methyltransferase [Moheibacter sp.]